MRPISNMKLAELNHLCLTCINHGPRAEKRPDIFVRWCDNFGD